MIGHAKRYSVLGWKVFPIIQGKKTPATENGFKDATTDEEIIKRWWGNGHNYNIGVEASSVGLILDVDKKNGKNGFVCLKALESEHGELPTTIIQNTPSGGKQFLFSLPNNIQIPCSVNTLGEGIDIRSTGGYFIAPPSLLSKTDDYPYEGTYEWILNQSPSEMKPSVAPDWLINLCLSKTNNKDFSLKETIEKGERNNTLFRYAVKLKKTGMSVEEIKSAILTINKRCPVPLGGEEIDTIINSASRYGKEEKREGNRINPLYEHALQIKEGWADGQYVYSMNEDKFYHYHTGFWEQIGKVDFLGRIEENIPEVLRYDIALKRNILEHFKQLGRKKISDFNKEELMNLENGMLCPRTNKLFPHAADFMSTLRLPVKYDSTSKCDLWIKTLSEIFEGDNDKIKMLQEFFGLCLTKETKYIKALLLLGESKCGKSTILFTLRHLLGGDINCSSVALKYLSNPQHTPDLMNKLVNIDTEVSEKAVEFEAEFKAITGGEPVRSNQKYVIACSFVPYCKLVLAANNFPKITDHSSAFYNRLILIPCNRIFLPEEQDLDLPKKLYLEVSGILNWAIEGLIRLEQRGRFEQMDFIKEAIEELEDTNNPVNNFFNEHIVVESGSYIEKGSLYDKFKSWAIKNNNYQLSASRFSSCVFKRFHKQTPKTCQHMETKKRIWKNLKYIDEIPMQGEKVQWQD